MDHYQYHLGQVPGQDSENHDQPAHFDHVSSHHGWLPAGFFSHDSDQPGQLFSSAQNDGLDDAQVLAYSAGTNQPSAYLAAPYHVNGDYYPLKEIPSSSHSYSNGHIDGASTSIPESSSYPHSNGGEGGASPAILAGPDPKDGQEMPKRIASKKSWRAVYNFALFQIPSVAVTLLLLGLYTRNFSWSADPQILNGLLFVARVHEALIVASLSQILYYHIRRGLLGPRGVPFGFLTAAFQLSSPYYMLSSGFWAPLLSSGAISLYSLGFSLLLVVSFVLAALSGASSSVVMLPQQQWRQLPPDHHTLDLRKNATRLTRMMRDAEKSQEYTYVPVPFQLAIVSPPMSLYPSVVDLAGISELCFSEPREPAKGIARAAADNCPFYNWVSRDSNAYRWMYHDLGSSANVSVNWAIYPDGTLHKLATYKDWATRSLKSPRTPFDMVAATRPLTPIYDLIAREGSYWPGISPTTPVESGRRHPVRMDVQITDSSGQGLPVKQPRVVIQCSDENYDLLSESPQDEETFMGDYQWHFSKAFYPEFNMSMPREPLFSLTSSVVETNVTFGFVEHKLFEQYLPDGITVSGAFFMRWDRYFGSSATPAALREKPVNYNTTFCLVDARWVEAEVWGTPLDSPLKVEHSLSISDNETMMYTLPSSAGDKDGPSRRAVEQGIIHLSAEWLDLINAKLINDTGFDQARFLGSPRPETVFEQIQLRSSWLSMDPNIPRKYPVITASLAVLLTDALSRVPYAHGWWLMALSPTGPWVPHRAEPRYGLERVGVVNKTLEELDETGTEYATIVLRYHELVYGYTFTTTAVKLAWAVLLGHLAMVLLHLGTVVLVHRGWNSEAWSQLGDLMSLALGSKRPGITSNARGCENGEGVGGGGADEKEGIGLLLKNTGVGVERWKTWRLRAFVREAKGEDGKVELVLRDEVGLARSEVRRRRRRGRKDGDEWDEQLGRMPVEDCKYG